MDVAFSSDFSQKLDTRRAKEMKISVAIIRYLFSPINGK